MLYHFLGQTYQLSKCASFAKDLGEFTPICHLQYLVWYFEAGNLNFDFSTIQLFFPVPVIFGIVIVQKLKVYNAGEAIRAKHGHNRHFLRLFGEITLLRNPQSRADIYLGQ